ncbi:MAG TPA: rod-binding protein [Planctomycetota bacterium]|nr:rod-binding protein [Planctomycetota bacterium]
MTQLALPTDATRFTVTPPVTSYDVTGPARDGQDELRTQAGRFIAGTFFGMMLRAMRGTVPEDGLMSGGRGEAVFQEFFDRELGQRFSDGESFALVEAAVRQLSGRADYRQKMLRTDGDPEMRRETGVSMRDAAEGDGGQP